MQLQEVNELLNDIEKQSDLGPSIMENVAQSFAKTINRPLSKETKAKLREAIKIPENCKDFSAPKINNEIWRIIPSHARLSDVKSQQNQQALGCGMSALALISNMALQHKKDLPKELLAAIIKTSLDASNIMGDQFQQISSSRRMDIKRFLNPEYAGICNAQISQSEWLFGSDLSESLKTSKATSSLIRNTSGIRGNSRFTPYNKFNRPSANTSGTLNYSRPFRPFRGNGQFRQNSYRPSSNFQPAWKTNQQFKQTRN